MNRTIVLSVALTILCVVPVSGCARQRISMVDDATTVREGQSPWQDEFAIAERTLVPTGRNPYFILEPGFQIVLEGNQARVVITVLGETVEVDGVVTRVVEEREWINGDLIEVSRNFYAIDAETNDVFYFGEDVDIYENGKVVKHTGEWRAGSDNAKAGMMIPGRPTVGLRYYQEVAPGVAMDRAEVISLNETLQTPVGTFSELLKTEETTPLNPAESDYKSYAQGIGLIQDAGLLVTRHGFIQQ